MLNTKAIGWGGGWLAAPEAGVRNWEWEGVLFFNICLSRGKKNVKKWCWQLGVKVFNIFLIRGKENVKKQNNWLGGGWLAAALTLIGGI